MSRSLPVRTHDRRNGRVIGAYRGSRIRVTGGKVSVPGRVFSACMLVGGFTLLGIIMAVKAVAEAVRALVRRWRLATDRPSRRSGARSVVSDGYNVHLRHSIRAAGNSLNGPEE